MASLIRTSACGFPIEAAATVDELFSMSEEERLGKIIPLEELFRYLPEVVLPAFYERLFRSGCEIYQKKIGTKLDTDTIVRVSGERCGFFALGRVSDYENGTAIKSVKLFSL